MQLRQGDLAKVIFPASHLLEDGYKLEKGVALLESWGLIVDKINISPPHFYLSANDELRLDELKKAIECERTKLIYCARGGYGSARIVRLLKDIKVGCDKFLLGFSDITTLHLKLLKEKKIHCIHAPNLVSGQLLSGTTISDHNQKALQSILFNEYNKSSFLLSPLNRLEAVDTSPITGGNLTLLVTSLATDFEIDTDHHILLIEEVSEKPYRIDRMLTHLDCAGKFDKVKAIILGDMKDCHSPSINLNVLLQDYFKNAIYPVYTADFFGHSAINLAWSYKHPCQIKVDNSQAKLVFN